MAKEKEKKKTVQRRGQDSNPRPSFVISSARKRAEGKKITLGRRLVKFLNQKFEVVICISACPGPGGLSLNFTLKGAACRTGEAGSWRGWGGRPDVGGEWLCRGLLCILQIENNGGYSVWPLGLRHIRGKSEGTRSRKGTEMIFRYTWLVRLCQMWKHEDRRLDMCMFIICIV